MRSFSVSCQKSVKLDQQFNNARKSNLCASKQNRIQKNAIQNKEQGTHYNILVSLLFLII